MAKPKYTIHDFNRDYPDDDACFEAVVAMVYPDGITCRKCGQVRPHAKLSNRRALSCAHCGTHVYPLAGTIFEKSTTPLKSWFYAIYLMGSTRCGISAKQLERELGVTYKTAWRMFKQIRALMDEDNGPLSGEVEVDETWIGGKLGNNNKYRNGVSPFANKTAVVGAVERGGKVATKVVKNVRRAEIMPLVAEKVMPEATVFTDEARSYDGLGNRGYQHHRVNHSARVYVTGNVHTNTIEGFWSLFKNSIRGTHHAVGAAYLQSYLNEYTFRYNRRNDPMPMFRAIQGRVSQVRAGRYGEYAPLR